MAVLCPGANGRVSMVVSQRTAAMCASSRSIKARGTLVAPSTYMTTSELASALTAVLVGRDGAVRLTITDDWWLHVHGVSYSVGLNLPPEQRSVQGALAAVRAVAPWAIPWGAPSGPRSSRSNPHSCAGNLDS